MIDFSTPITDLEGAPQMRPDMAAETLVPVTLGWLCRAALSTDIKDEQAGGDEKIARIELALKIPREGEAELSKEEAVAVCQRVARVFGAIATYRATELLDPAKLHSP